jgi:hypothetical protein
MSLPRDAMLLRIFFGEDDKFQGRPLHEAIVEAHARRAASRRDRPAGPYGVRTLEPPAYDHNPEAF